jgi:hypothetical protein
MGQKFLRQWQNAVFSVTCGSGWPLPSKILLSWTPWPISSTKPSEKRDPIKKTRVAEIDGGQGGLLGSRMSGTGSINYLQQDGGIKLMIRSEAPKPQTPPPMLNASRRRASSLAVLSISEIQNLADQIHTLTKPLAGMEPQIEVRISVKTKADGDLSFANGILEKIKAGWKL